MSRRTIPPIPAPRNSGSFRSYITPAEAEENNQNHVKELICATDCALLTFDDDPPPQRPNPFNTVLERDINDWLVIGSSAYDATPCMGVMNGPVHSSVCIISARITEGMQWNSLELPMVVTGTITALLYFVTPPPLEKRDNKIKAYCQCLG